jgi:predicted CopG family antitoxin
MVKTIRVSEEYHAWLSAHKRGDETMEETLRRMTRGPHPDDVAGLLSKAEAETAKQAVERLRGRDRDRLDAAGSAFETANEAGIGTDDETEDSDE